MSDIRIFDYNSSEYQQSLQLRYRILRVPLNLEFTEGELKKDIEDVHLGLFEDRRIVACLILTKTPNQRMKMRQVAVESAKQGKGLGRRLSEAAESFAKQHGFRIMFCHARKTAVPFYNKMGYKTVGEEFTEVNIPHYLMEKEL